MMRAVRPAAVERTGRTARIIENSHRGDQELVFLAQGSRQFQHGRRPDLLRDVVAHHLVGWSVRDEPTLFDLHGARAETTHGVHIVAYEEDGAPRAGDPLHLPQTLALEVEVAHSQNLVDQKDLGLSL